MATARFKSSPYTNTENFAPHGSDSISRDLDALTGLSHATNGVERPDVVRVALVGLGRIGVMYLLNITQNPDTRLGYVVLSPRQDPALLREKYNIPRDVHVTCDLDTALTDRAITAVVIATSTATHVDIILRSLEAGKAVFCEKPISESEAGVRKCYEAARTAALPLFCGFNRRFDPTYRAIAERVKRGEVGHVQTIKSVSRDSPIVPREFIPRSGGIFHDFAVHDVDLLLWVVGEPPARVYVSGVSHIPEFRAEGDLDAVIITLTFPSGTLGVIDLNRFSPYGYDQRLEVFGPGGMLEGGTRRADTMALYTRDGGYSTTPRFFSFPSHYAEAFAEEVRYFVDLVRERGSCSVTEKQILAVSRVIAACETSAKTGLPIDITWSKEDMPEY